MFVMCRNMFLMCRNMFIMCTVIWKPSNVRFFVQDGDSAETVEGEFCLGALTGCLVPSERTSAVHLLGAFSGFPMKYDESGAIVERTRGGQANFKTLPGERIKQRLRLSRPRSRVAFRATGTQIFVLNRK